MALLYWSFSLHLKSSPNSSHALVLPCIFSHLKLSPPTLLHNSHTKFLPVPQTHQALSHPRAFKFTFPCAKISPVSNLQNNTILLAFTLSVLPFTHQVLAEKLLFKSLSHVQLYVTPWTTAFMGFPRQEYWSGLPFPSTGAVPIPGIEPGSPALQVDSFITESPGKPSQKSNLWKAFLNFLPLALPLLTSAVLTMLHICIFAISSPLGKKLQEGKEVVYLFLPSLYPYYSIWHIKGISQMFAAWIRYWKTIRKQVGFNVNVSLSWCVFLWGFKAPHLHFSVHFL